MEWKKLFLALAVYLSLTIVLMSLHKTGTVQQKTTHQIQTHFQIIPGIQSQQLVIHPSQQKPIPYIQLYKFKTEESIMMYIDNLFTWNEEKVDDYSGAYKQTKVANMGYRIYSNPESPMHQQAQYYYYHKKYNIGEISNEIQMCIIAAGRNLLKNDKYKVFFTSINNQNYSNYHLIVADDNSKDYSAFFIREYIKEELPRLHGKTTLLYNHANIGALANKDQIIRKFCKEGSVIVDMDADDALVGRQVLKVLNSVYQNESNWFVYSNHVVFEEGKNYPEAGYSDYLYQHILKENRYRTTEYYWATGHLKTYRFQLYSKIPQSYFCQKDNDYFLWASDRFIMYAITELAANNHIFHIPECLYFYNRNPPRAKCTMAPIIKDEYFSRSRTPFVPLEKLDESAIVVENYEIPEEIEIGLAEKLNIYQECLDQRERL